VSFNEHLPQRSLPSSLDGRGLTSRAQKADTPPPWARDSITIKKLLQGAWQEVSSDFVKKLLEAFRSNNRKAIDALLGEVKGMGPNLTDALGNATEAAYSNLLLKAETYWNRHAEDVGISGPKAMGEKYREQMAIEQAAQVKRFVDKYPERIVQPIIMDQIDKMKDVRHPDAFLITSIEDRLSKLDKSQDYWDTLSEVQTSRVWNASGVMHAAENGIVTGRITGAFDALTCKVCRRMMGMPVDIAQAMEKYGADLNIQDPDAYVEAWPFPRLADVEGRDPEELAQEGWLPPFHPNG
jgi:hypothetical protein